jgi:hypothetical protein
MTDPISVATFALSLIKTAGEQLNKLRERAQATKDLEIKEHVGNLYDTMNAIKEAFSRLVDENKQLKRELEQQQLARVAVPKIKQVGETNYYFQGDDGPFCQPCYDGAAKTLVALSPQHCSDWDHAVTRECPVCRRTFYEQRGREQRTIEPYGGGGGGADEWMR